MVNPIQATGPGMNPARWFGYNGGRDKNFTPQMFAATTPHNMIRNGAFESWSQGAVAGCPDAWEWDSIGALDRTTTATVWGQYALRITKNSSDGAVTKVFQSLHHMVTSGNETGKVFTVSFRIKTDQGDETIRPFVYDGTNYHYGRYYNNDDDWEEIWFSHQGTTAPTAFDVGVEVEETASGSDVYFYVDCAVCCWGSVPTQYNEHPNDRSPICQHWIDDGTRVEVRGAMRCIPYMVEGTFTGGAWYEIVTVNLIYGVKEIIHVSVNPYTLSATYRKLMNHYTTNYTTTQFDIVIALGTGNVTATNYKYTGTIWAIGWDNEEEQWK